MERIGLRNDVAVEDAIEASIRWQSEGCRVAMATLVAVSGSGPRDPGAMMAVNERGEIAGSLSGGCIESDVVERAERILAGAPSESVRYGPASKVLSLQVGVTCGAGIEIWIERLECGWHVRASAALARARPVAILIEEPGVREGRHVYAIACGSQAFGGSVDFSIGAALTDGRARLVSGAGSRTFVRPLGVRPEMIVFGAVDFARAVASIGRFLGYCVTIVDPRARFATRSRLPDADEIVVAWPDEYLQGRVISEKTALVVLTHDERFDVPLLAVALETPAAYIGVMGSRETHARRLAALRRLGVSDSSLARMHAPIGLDIGARSPEEVAISIAAELVSIAHGRGGASLRDTKMPIHAEAYGVA